MRTETRRVLSYENLLKQFLMRYSSRLNSIKLQEMKFLAVRFKLTFFFKFFCDLRTGRYAKAGYR
jgi:hypothetical protein